MFVVTFYSYKGGVGRTMALVNVAVAEAKLGKKVLVVDFDLEAPGLPSYRVFEDAGCDRGIVDFVTAYRATSAAPTVSDYITKAAVEGSPIWLMPAGRYTQRGYTDQLNSIDWQELYEHQEGYLMFEDLKRQWEDMGFDYVLIDSRTGHTDVGGICTRQLPDAVVIMFLPNQQNIGGLQPIVESIKAENKSRKKKIELHFCASNVPNLDDELNILKDALTDASKKLNYDPKKLSTVKHYSSLEVLTQSAFVISRANSQLAREYEDLRSSIVALNLEDREGAIVALGAMPESYETARRRHQTDARKAFIERTREIRSLHPDDGEIAFLAAHVLSEVNDTDGEIEALNVAIDRGHEINRARLARAYGHLVYDDRDAAVGDLTAILQSQTATVFELGPALQLLKGMRGWTADLEVVLDRPDDDFETILALGSYLMRSRDPLPALARRLERSVRSESLPPRTRRVALNDAVLCYIGAGLFQSAKDLLGLDPSAISRETHIQDIFNFAVADWGESRTPNAGLFAEVISQTTSPKGLPAEDSNLHQCLALAQSVVGDDAAAALSLHEAVQIVAVSPGEMVFSCWRYLYLTGEEMLVDLRAMQEVVASGGRLEPAFFEEVKRLVH